MEKNQTMQEVYKNSSDEVKEILKNKFSKDDLGIGIDENQIRNEILDLIRKNIKNVRFLNKDGSHTDLPTNRFEIYDEYENWLFEIDYTEKKKVFLYSYFRVFSIFETKYEIKLVNFNKMMITVLVEDLKMCGVTPCNG